MDETVKKIEKELREREKELSCLYAIIDLVEKPGLSLQEILKGIVGLLPESLGYPENACARIELSDTTYTSVGFAETQCVLHESIHIHDMDAGRMTVCYRYGDDQADRPVFLPEEENLIKGVAEMTGKLAERKLAEISLHESENRLAQIVNGNSIATFVIDADHNITHWNTACENLTGVKAAEVLGTPKHWMAFYARQQAVLADLVVDKTPEGEIIQFYGGKAHTSKIVDGAFEAELFFPDLGDTGKWLFFTASPLRNMQGEINGAIETLQDVTKRKLAEEALRSELADLELELKGRYRFQSIIGKSESMQKLYNLLEDLADTDTTVLITGESGTGKELVAKALHYSGVRADKPLVSVNCSALTETLLESELFGHIRGAFTGALKDKVGRFQLANNGSILLDEIGDISPAIQLKLLRVLQEKEFERVGESSSRKVDVRVLAATNCDLAEKVRSGAFREDLYYRLKVVEVRIPPLRERLDDIPLLIDHFCRMFQDKFNKNIKNVSKEVLELFMKHSWPGNVRELEHALEHAFIICHGSILLPDHLPAEIVDSSAHTLPGAERPRITPPHQVQQALDTAGWNKAKAARLLGISRPTLYNLIKRYDLTDPAERV